MNFCVLNILHLPSWQALIYLLGNRHKHMKEVFNNNLPLKNNLKKLVKHYSHLTFVNQGESTFPIPSALIIFLFLLISVYTLQKYAGKKIRFISVTISCEKKKQNCIVLYTFNQIIVPVCPSLAIHSQRALW